MKQLALDNLLERIFAPEGAYSLFLAGPARSRATETMRMALALWQHAILGFIPRVRLV